MFSQMPKARIKKLPKINIFEDVSREHIPTDINNFDKSQLKKMETVEKVVLPKTEGITHSTYFSSKRFRNSSREDLVRDWELQARNAQSRRNPGKGTPSRGKLDNIKIW